MFWHRCLSNKRWRAQEKLRLTGQSDSGRRYRWSCCERVLPKAKSVGARSRAPCSVGVSGGCTQTDSKALRAIWCLSNSQRNSRNFEMHNARVQKTVKGGPKCVLNPLVAEGGRDVCLATGFSQIHTGLQMAKIFRQFHKQGYHALWEESGDWYLQWQHTSQSTRENSMFVFVPKYGWQEKFVIVIKMLLRCLAWSTN